MNSTSSPGRIAAAMAGVASSTTARMLTRVRRTACMNNRVVCSSHISPSPNTTALP